MEELRYACIGRGAVKLKGLRWEVKRGDVWLQGMLITIAINILGISDFRYAPYAPGRRGYCCLRPHTVMYNHDGYFRKSPTQLYLV